MFKGQTDCFTAPLKGLFQTKAILLQDECFFIELSPLLYMQSSPPVEQISTFLDTAEKTTCTELLVMKIRFCPHGSS